MFQHIETKRVVILGTSGTSVDMLDILWDLNERAGKVEYECVAFVDDDSNQYGKDFHGYEVFGPIDNIAQTLGSKLVAGHPWYINGIGGPNGFRKKPEIIARSGICEDRFLTLVHPSAYVSRSAVLGKDVVLFQNVVIGSNVIIGDHIVVLPNTVINHDAIIGDYTTITSGVCISGTVYIGHGCYLGTNACIREKVEIGAGCLIGMGSVVIRDVPYGEVVAGNPAKPIQGRTKECNRILSGAYPAF